MAVTIGIACNAANVDMISDNFLKELFFKKNYELFGDNWQCFNAVGP